MSLQVYPEQLASLQRKKKVVKMFISNSSSKKFNINKLLRESTGSAIELDGSIQSDINAILDKGRDKDSRRQFIKKRLGGKGLLEMSRTRSKDLKIKYSEINPEKSLIVPAIRLEENFESNKNDKFNSFYSTLPIKQTRSIRKQKQIKPLDLRPTDLGSLSTNKSYFHRRAISMQKRVQRAKPSKTAPNEKIEKGQSFTLSFKPHTAQNTFVSTMAPSFPHRRSQTSHTAPIRNLNMLQMQKINFWRPWSPAVCSYSSVIAGIGADLNEQLF